MSYDERLLTDRERRQMFVTEVQRMTAASEMASRLRARALLARTRARADRLHQQAARHEAEAAARFRKLMRGER